MRSFDVDKYINKRTLIVFSIFIIFSTFLLTLVTDNNVFSQDKRDQFFHLDIINNFLSIGFDSLDLWWSSVKGLVKEYPDRFPYLFINIHLYKLFNESLFGPRLFNVITHLLIVGFFSIVVPIDQTSQKRVDKFLLLILLMPSFLLYNFYILRDMAIAFSSVVAATPLYIVFLEKKSFDTKKLISLSLMGFIFVFMLRPFLGLSLLSIPILGLLFSRIEKKPQLVLVSLIVILIFQLGIFIGGIKSIEKTSQILSMESIFLMIPKFFYSISGFNFIFPNFEINNFSIWIIKRLITLDRMVLPICYCLLISRFVVRGRWKISLLTLVPAFIYFSTYYWYNHLVPIHYGFRQAIPQFSIMISFFFIYFSGLLNNRKEVE